MDLDAILLRAVGLGASDVHLKVGQPPVVRKDGELVHVTEVDALGDADLEAVLGHVTSKHPADASSSRRPVSSTSPTPRPSFRASVSTAFASAGRSRSPSA
jgi:Tfp pilus assembly pilus retraction ATPase PilT